VPPGVFASRGENAALVEGPPVEDVVTAFDDALSCLRGKVQPGITFAVGQIVDATGKETYAEGGTGKFVTQGSGEMVQSALFRAGVTVVNRRDPNIPIVETQWGIRDLQQQLPVNFYISGSINSLDFIPGGGFSAQVSGMGPRYRQNRILIGLDLSMTDALTGRIVASVPLQKQIFSSEMGASMGRFFGETLVSLDVGGQEREAVHFALRQMLSFATFELLGQLINAQTFAPCKEKVSPFYGTISNTGTGDAEALRMAAQMPPSRPAAPPAAAPQPAAAAPPQQQSSQRAARSIDEQVRELANHAMVFGARAVAAAEESMAAENLDDAAVKAAEATELLRGAVQILQRAAELGLGGPEGDAVALVVERGIAVVTQAQEELARRSAAARAPGPAAPPAGGPAEDPGAAAGPAPASEPAQPPAAVAPPGTPDAQRMGITE
jgi:curli biogenesis system outer membrane secretion channel CsgG